MAYLDLTHPFEILKAPAPETLPRVEDAALTATERQVILASLRDPASSLESGGRIRTALRWIFDVRPPNPLADARLEALRRFAVLMRRFGDRLSTIEIDRLAMAGYSPGQIREASRRIASAPGKSSSRDAR